MRFASLGSGSRGNSLVVEVGRTRVMLDCGFAVRETMRRLARLDLVPGDLSAVLVTHEGMPTILAGWPHSRASSASRVWLTHGTFNGAAVQFMDRQPVHLFDCHARFAIGAVEVQPFPVPHDAREPAQFVFGDGARRLGVLTDAGYPTPHIEETLDRCHALILECNHDRDMLRNGPYPGRLKQRVAGRLGHLDNLAAARLLGRIETSLLQHVVAAHLSEQNNLPDLARRALSGALNCGAEWIGIAEQDNGFDWRQVA